MSDPKIASTNRFTREVKAQLTPIVHCGTMKDCRAWAEAMHGRELLVVEANGTIRVVGVVTRTESKGLF